jgi:hypothetical protein
MDCPSTKMTGETMRARSLQNPNSAHRERMRDVLMVSSFGVWAVLLGFTPVFAIHALMGS